MSELLKDITDGTFETEVMKSKVPVLVDFWAEWCPPCRAMTPIVESLAQKFESKAKVVKLNVDDNPSVTQRFGIKGIPTMIVFKGGKEAERVVGATNEDALKRIIEEQITVVKA
ncbi:MAG TPA: thioredoxin [Pyrinomonadaceae bacterium]|jgi:thioredoxin 1|nr:thioredoxin [Pyrinomonadaceae bacterium]